MKHTRLANVVVPGMLLLATGCAPALSAPPATVEAKPAGFATAATTPTSQNPGPIPPSGVGVATAHATRVVVPGATPEEPKVLVSPAEVTLADLTSIGRATVQLDVGQRFLLNLDTTDFYDWEIEVADETIIQRVGDQAQGIYEAKKAGRTTLVARGDPRCRRVQPQCGAPSMSLTVQILVR